MTTLPKKTPRDRRIVKHIKALHEAGSDTAKFIESLEDLRDDPTLSNAHRDAIFRTLAQDAAQAYFRFVTGGPIDLSEALASLAEPGAFSADQPKK